jgi:HEAT repeat protein
MSPLPRRTPRKPDLVKLTSKKDVAGLIDALEYGKQWRLRGTHDIEATRAEVAEVSRGAVAALAELGDPRAIGPILDCFDRDEFSVFDLQPSLGRRPQFEPLALSRFGSAAVEPLIAALNHPKPKLRTVAAVALGHIGDQRAVSPLLRRGTPPLAVWALGKIGGGEEVVAALIATLLDSTSGMKERCHYAARALGSGNFGDAGVQALVTALPEDEGAVRPLVAFALCGLGDARGRDALLQRWYPDGQYKSVNPNVADTLAVLGKFGCQRVREFLHAALDDPEDDRYGSRRAFAAIALAQGGDVTAVDALLNVVGDAAQQGHYVQLWSDSVPTLAIKSLVALGSAARHELSEIARGSAAAETRAAAQQTLALVERVISSGGTPEPID